MVKNKFILLPHKDAQVHQNGEFDARQKKMTQAIEKQNDEICGLKREKESLRVKVNKSDAVSSVLKLTYLFSTKIFANMQKAL